MTLENAKIFKEEYLKRNVKMENDLDLQSMRLGLNSVIAVSNFVIEKNIHKINLADNSVSDYCMHAIKGILQDAKITSLNLASNLISGEGLELLLDTLIVNRNIKSLDFGVIESSKRKNSLGI